MRPPGRAWSLGLWLLAGACAPESIFIAHGPDAQPDADGAPREEAGTEAAAPLMEASVPDSGAGPSGGCASDDDCRLGYFCEKERCSDPVGL
ncbi:MAG TPA: hypothetical protein VFZ61_17345, partial [Polyangiales bacterium]